MSGTLFLQIFLYVNVFIVGVVSAIAAQHAYAHFRPEKHEPETPHPADQAAAKPVISPEAKERMIKASEEAFQKALARSVEHLSKDLEASSTQVNDLIKRFASDIVEDEMKRYHQALGKLHDTVTQDIGGVKDSLARHQAELNDQLMKEIEADRQFLTNQINTKLGDAVGSFLLEALQHNVDLGGQTAYLMSLLEEHKADFVKEIAREA